MADEAEPSRASSGRFGRKNRLIDDGEQVLKQVFMPPAAGPADGDTPPLRELTRCSVVIPAYNEQESLSPLHVRLTQVLDELGADYEIVLVDDGSTDQTFQCIRRLARVDPHVRYVCFARNFGHEAASTAGLDRADGDVVILMDADLQDPPELIPDLVEQWRRGHDVVCARRRRRQGESLFKRASAWCFYRLLNALAPMQVPLDTGDFRLMDRSVVGQFRRLRESDRFVRGLIAWIGHPQAVVEFDRPARHAGRCKYNLVKLAALSLDAIVGFSTRPLRAATLLGLATMIASSIAGLVLGRGSLLAAGIFFLGGVQMLLLGILGEYVGRIYSQVRGRPLYVVREEA
ncbi:MAG: glycosyltransferase family 2 protein [Planctomycetota bacterium]|jgi:dolichol-phosphate mannosyltransferase